MVGRTRDGSAQDRAASTDDRAESLLRDEAAAVHAYLARRVNPSEDAADLLSETMLIVWRKRGTIPQNLLEARMWFFGVARNVLLTTRRATRRRASLNTRLQANLATAPIHADRAGSPDDGGEDLRAHVRSVVGNLRDTDREIVTLVHWEGFTLEQTAMILSMRPSTVRTRYSRARARLRTLLIDSGGVPPTTH